MTPQMHGKEVFVDASELTLSNKKHVMHVLHVDDDVSLLEVSKEILLMENNFDIDIVTCVDEAFKKLENQNYDVIVSDYEMPQKNGLEFLKELREQRKEIPFILFTGRGREEVVVEALNLGADSYINKHGSPEAVYCELADAINKTVERKRSKQLLVESEQKYRSLVENSLQGILITLTSPLKLVFANSAMGNILGYSVEELKSLSPQGVAGLICGEDKAVFFKRLEERMSQEPAGSSLEFRAVRKDGSTIWLEAFANRIEYMGKPAVQGVFQDINERKKAKQALIDSEDKFRQAFAIGPNAFLISTLNEGEIIDANEGFLEMFGYSRQEVIGKSSVTLGMWADPLDRTSMVFQLKSEGKVKNKEIFCKRKNGEAFPVVISVSLLQSENHSFVLSVVQDVSSYKQTEAALRESEARYRMLTENTRDVIWTMNLDGHFTYVSPSVFQLRGYTSDEVLQQSMLEALTPESAQKILEGMQQFWEKGTLASNYFELEQPCKDGSTIWTEVNFTILRNKNGDPESILGVSRDITESRKAKNELKMAANIFDLATDSILVHDFDGNIVFFNEAASKSMGYSKKEMATMNIRMIDAPEYSKLIKPRMNDLLEKGDAVFDSVHVRKDKTLIQVEIHARVINQDGEQLILSLARDITERKKAEEKLENNKNYFGTLINSVLSGIIVVDGETRRIIDANPAALKLMGATRENAVGRVCHQFICPNEIGKCPIIDKNQTIDKAEKVILNSEGKRVPVLKSVVKIKHNGRTLLVENYVDISARKNAEANLQENQRRLELMNEKLNVVGRLTRDDVRNKLSSRNSKYIFA